MVTTNPAVIMRMVMPHVEVKEVAALLLLLAASKAASLQIAEILAPGRAMVE